MFNSTVITTEVSEAISASATPSAPVIKRGRHDEITNPPAAVRKLVAAVKASAGWQEGIESLNSRGGFEARSIDVFGFDESRNLAVVQLRRSYKRKASHFMQVSKAYALIGIDDGQVFSHVLENSPRRLRDIAERSPESVVRWAEKMIFGLKNEADVDGIKRQGDIALVPVKKLPADSEPVADGVTFRGSHRLVGQVFKSPSGGYYCTGGRDTRMLHTKREHGAVHTAKGTVFHVVVGRRGDEPWWIDATLGD